MKRRDIEGRFIRTRVEPTITFCLCGCGKEILSHDKRGRPRRYLYGHHKGHWKGGKRINSQGYIETYSPNHPFKGCRNTVREHRLVMEKQLGRYLQLSEVVHHKNGNKQDNRIENLKLMAKKQHDALTASENIFFQKGRGFCPRWQSPPS